MLAKTLIYGIKMNHILLYYSIDFIIILLVVAGLRWFSNLIAHVDLHHILTEEDNAAHGIALSGALIGLSIMLMGASSGEVATNPIEEFKWMLVYGILGLVLMWLTRQFFDHLALPQISISTEIQKQNCAAGLLDAGNMIASAIIVRAMMIWVEVDQSIDVLWILLGFIASQILLYFSTLYRLWLFKRFNKGTQFHQAIEQGNIALALRFVGYRIGMALVISASSGFLNYDHNIPITMLALWSAMGLLLAVVASILSLLLRRVLLPRVNISAEVTEKNNLAIGSLEAAIYLSMGLIFVGLLA